MSVFHPYSVKCGCGTKFGVQLAESINVVRQPRLRQEILDGTLHRVQCPSCKRRFTVEKELSYADTRLNTFIKVKPRREQHLWQEASAKLRKEARALPEQLSPKANRTLRVVFGMAELREKIVAQDAGLDDRLLEVLKALLAYEHPVLLQKPRLKLLLHRQRSDGLEFVATFEHAPQRFRLMMPGPVYQPLLKESSKLQEWVKKAHRISLFDLKDDFWVNLTRFSPLPSALATLRKLADAVAAKQEVDLGSKEFARMVKYLPRGSHLPGWAKQALRVLDTYAKAKGKPDVERELFQVRFGIALEDDWAMNDDPEDIDTLWKLLKDLPDTNVEGNTAIHEILVDDGNGGGWYDPSSHDIAIGQDELRNREGFEDVMRHEVGHSVHEKLGDRINQWLEQRFGWKQFTTGPADIDAWVALMGGWGTLAPAQRQEVRDFITKATGPGAQWEPGPAPTVPAGHPWLAPDFGPRLAYEQTGGNWFMNNARWYRSHGKAFFYNFWYRSLMVVDEKTLDLINQQMPSKYAAMSPFEFFAELYALYYDLDDPKWRNVPEDAAAWLDANIGKPEPLAA